MAKAFSVSAAQVVDEGSFGILRVRWRFPFMGDRSIAIIQTPICLT
jgi:hypothetical protein